MVIAGFDPGSSVFGIGVIKQKGKDFEYLFSKEIKFPKCDFNRKMEILLEELDKYFDLYSPDEVAIEDGFLGKNVKSMNILSKIRGVVLAKSIMRNKELMFYSPREVKIAVSGNGNASKEQVNKMVKYIFKLRETKIGNDESDALAVAYCHSVNKRSLVR